MTAPSATLSKLEKINFEVNWLEECLRVKVSGFKYEKTAK